ncbi:MAG: type IV pilus secretin PilQ, partial [Nitrospinota bacterium]|nr:type IV pilus secretin PilQ [Nitrospinota bacterium]
EKVDEMITVIKTLDVQTPQVMIESKLVEVNKNYAQELGIQWGAYTERKDFSQPEQFPSLIRTGGDRATRLQGDIPIDPGLIVDLGIPSDPTGQFGIVLATLNADHTLDIQLEAMESQGKSRTVSNPKVTTLDNTEAKIQSGQRVPVITQSNNEGIKIEFVEVNLELKVTPHITADENIYMKIAATQNNADFANSVFGSPSINTKEAFTEVLVYNGTTTVLGGIYQKEMLENRTNVPFFADIPIIGYLFKNRIQSDEITELLIFVTPTIVRSETAYTNQ